MFPRFTSDGCDAEEFSSPGWGSGFHAVLPLPQLSNMLAGTAGLELINLMEENIGFRDDFTGLWIE